MRVTIKEKEEVVNFPCLKDVQPGEVFEFLSGGGSMLLKLRQGKITVVKTNSYNSVLDCYVDSNWSNDSPVQILGKLTEIVVDPNA